MGDQRAGHEVGERLFVDRDSPVHRLPASVKLVSALLTVLVIVATPNRLLWPFLLYAALIVVVMAVARLPARQVIPRMVVEVPFLVFAALMPIIGTGPEIAVGPWMLSEPGIWAAWGMAAKATLGVLISITLAATTSTSAMIEGLRRLRMPDLFVQILSAMVRYVHVVGAESARMSRARAARGFRLTGPRSWGVLAQSIGTLFIRSYERGERVHLAMLSRGYSGEAPVLHAATPVTVRTLALGLSLPLAVLVVRLAALT